MNDLQKLLTEIHRLSNEVTPAPWEIDENGHANHLVHDSGLYVTHCEECNDIVLSEEDAKFIALARTALPQLASILQAVIYDCESIIEAIDQKKITHPARRGIKVQAGTTLQVIAENLGGVMNAN